MNVNDNYIEQTVFTSKIDSLKTMYSAFDTKIIVSHIGDFDQNKINAIVNIVENQLEQLAASKKAVKKIFNIIIETLQNIKLHGEKDEKVNQMTYFILGKKDNEYNIYSGNIVTAVQAEKLNKRLNAIKSLNATDLKKRYVEVLSNGELSAKGGAGLGFLTMALKTDNAIDFEFEDINKNYSLFSLHSKVKD